MRKVRHLKVALAAAAIALTVGVFWWAGPGPQEELMRRMGMDEPQPGRVPTTDAEQLKDLADSAELVMEAPRFFGSDDTGRRWEVRAHEARQKGVDGGMVELLEVAAETSDADNRPITLNAVRGIFVQATSHIDLRDGVTVMAYGHTLSTSEAQYGLEERTLALPQRVTLHGPMGSVEAAQGEARDNGREISLTGGVRVYYNPTGE